MKQLLCFGDSNTWGLIPKTHERYSWGVRWTSLLQEKLEKHDIRVLKRAYAEEPRYLMMHTAKTETDWNRCRRYSNRIIRTQQ